MPTLPFRRILLGCDPEMFFRHGEKVLGAANVLPLSGLEYRVGEVAGGRTLDGSIGQTRGEISRVIIDGVQAELNPRPSDCRALLVNEISALFRKLNDHLKQFNNVKIDFAQTIFLSDEEFEELPENSKKFGCMPSKNANDGGKEGSISVDPSTYRFRSAGGHIHMGNPFTPDGWNLPLFEYVKKVLDNPERLVRMMDILVGNTCVLIDRDNGNIERRKVYGRAGEFRTPPHGVEYRTLSNFWLRHSTLVSLVMGLTRQAFILVAEDKDRFFVDAVNMSEIEQAINKNDFALALSNFNKIAPLIAEFNSGENGFGDYPLSGASLPAFRHFYTKGIDYWFKEDPVDHWLNLTNGHDTGFEVFLYNKVQEDMKNA